MKQKTYKWPILTFIIITNLIKVAQSNNFLIFNNFTLVAYSFTLSLRSITVFISFTATEPKLSTHLACCFPIVTNYMVLFTVFSLINFSMTRTFSATFFSWIKSVWISPATIITKFWTLSTSDIKIPPFLSWTTSNTRALREGTF